MIVETLLVPLDGTTLPPREEIGGKAWSIARMRTLGLPVPPAVVLPVRACRDFLAHSAALADEPHAEAVPPEAVLPEELWSAVRRGVRLLEDDTGRTFGHGPRPLLLSVRSGAPVSMPGMMDTVLNLGMNDTIEAALAEESGDPGYAADTHARFVEAYGRIVCRATLDEPEPGSTDVVNPHSAHLHSAHPHSADPGRASALRERVFAESGQWIPDDPWEQLGGAVAAVFRSWNSRRAKAYRRHWGIPDDGGTAVTVQAMVFGNSDERSGTGVLFTRDPRSGAPEPHGEYLPCAQGEEVVSGARTPLPVSALRDQLPDVYDRLVTAGRTLERDCGDVQDIEFTVQRGRLFLLQSRSAKRSARAAVRIAADMVREGTLTPAQAVHRVSAEQVRALLRPALDSATRAAATLLLRGDPACPGIAHGTVVAGADAAEQRGATGEAVVLAASTTSPEDVPGMLAATAVLTESGGSTCHAAVVSRAVGRPCVVGCGRGALDDLVGREVTVDGETGEVFAGVLPVRTVSSREHPDCAALLEWATALAPLTVLTADSAPPGTLDLDACEIVDADDLDRVLRGAEAARGRILTTDDGVRAAVRAGLATVVADEPLPVLLAAITAARTRHDPPERSSAPL